MKKWIVAALVLAGCTENGMKTAEGCPIYLSEVMQGATRACQAAYHEEMARARGGVVTRCLPDGGGGMSCTSY
jgi:hypothetical protein